jgi:hypothetical protein
MDFVRRVVIFVEWTMIGLLVLVLAVFLLDLIEAWNAQSCAVRPVANNCYPWGKGTEGPIAGAWNYESKRNYLASAIYTEIVLGLTLLGAFMVAKGRRIFVLLGAWVFLKAGEFLLPLFV